MVRVQYKTNPIPVRVRSIHRECPGTGPDGFFSFAFVFGRQMESLPNGLKRV